MVYAARHYLLRYASPPPCRFDAVLLDAPCSATGTIRRHPDLPFVRDPSTLKEVFALQTAMLDHALTLLAPKGRLVFCTCSLLPEEGEEQIKSALARHDGAQNLLARLADYVGDDIGQLDVHLGQSLLHVLHEASLAAQQHGALAAERAQHADLIGRAEGAVQQAKAHELLQPLAVQHIALAARDVLDVAGVDQVDFKPGGIKHFEQGDPVHASGLHCYSCDATFTQPLHQTLQVGSERQELAYWLIIPFPGHGNEMAGGTDINTAGAGVGDAQSRDL